MSTPNQDMATSLGYMLKKTQHALRMHMDERLKSLELTTPQYAVLSQLALNSGISNAQLARNSFVTAQTMHGIVSNLEKRCLLKRKRDPNHGRILSAELTKQGKIIVKKAHFLVKEAEANMTKTMDKKTEKRLEKLLIECMSNLGVN